MILLPNVQHMVVTEYVILQAPYLDSVCAMSRYAHSMLYRIWFVRRLLLLLYCYVVHVCIVCPSLK
jgi:hypothetical protein